VASTAWAAPLPFLNTGGKPYTEAVFRRDQKVRWAGAAWTVTDAEGKTVASGRPGGALPTSRFGAYRVATAGRPSVFYAVAPDVRSAAANRSAFGMGAYFSMRYSPQDQKRCAALLVRMGAVSSRDELNWDLVEPQPGNWTWGNCDAGVGIQHDFGIEPLGLLCYWGKYVKDRPERSESLVAHSPEAVAAYAEYCRRCVRRYKPGGELARLRGWKDGWGIRHWEVWNEPATFWTGTPEQFGNLLKAGYQAIKREDPRAIVHFSNVGKEWDAKALRVAGKSFDGLTPHYYCPPRSPDDADMDRQMRETVKEYAARGLKRNLWVSEVGWDSTSDREQQVRQAQDLVRAYAMALDAGMQRVFWYNFRNDGDEGPGGQIPWFGVINRDCTPRISYAAYAAMVARLQGLKPAGRANLGAAVKAILFTARGGTTAVLWADKQRGSLEPIRGAIWYDLMGNAQSGRIPLNDWPVYVVAPGKPAAWLRERLRAAAIKGIAPVVVKPFQFLSDGDHRTVSVDLRNQSSREATVKLTASQGHVQVVLAPGERRRVSLPVSKAGPALGCVVTQGGAARRWRISLAGTPSTVIPFGEREAPIYDQLWALTPKWTMATAEHNAGIMPWSPKDLSVVAQFQYDESGLWMRFIVADNVFHQTQRGRDIWQEDSVQVSLQADGSKAAVRHAFGFALTPDGPKAFRYAGPGGWLGTLDVRRRGTETTYDVRVPWSDLAPLKPLPGQRFLMDFMVNDNDGFGRRGWLEWTPGIGTGDDPSKWMEWSLGTPGPAPTRT
jgi:hypothetical protein